MSIPFMSSFSWENQGGISFKLEEGMRKYSAVDSSNKLKDRLPADQIVKTVS